MSPDLLDSFDPNERFRQRRDAARRRRRMRRKAAAGVVALLLVLVAAIAAGASYVTTNGGSGDSAREREAAEPKKKQPVRPRPLPLEVRGVHVTAALASDPSRIDRYLRIPGLTALQLDVKDENGEVGFLMPNGTLARKIGAAKPYYKAGRVAAKARENGVYLIGRVVCFEDPILSQKRPDLAIRHADGRVWTNDIGLGWTNPYDRRVWDYLVEIGKAAAQRGFDEIQFDYVRFPSDGNVEDAVYRFKNPREPMGWTIARFVHYATQQLRPLGVRVSVDVFGLSATHDLGIGQVPGRLAKYVDAIYPMVYPSHYNPGEYNLPDPSATPGTTVARSLADFRRAMRGKRARLIPWLEDFSLGRTRTPEEVRDQIQAARDYRAKGFLLWNPTGVYTEEVLQRP